MSQLAQSIEFVAHDQLREAPDNVRIHPDSQISALVESLRTFGFPSPIIVDEENTILVGHGRLRAARTLYAERGRIKGVPPGRVPIVRASGLTPEERRAYRIADNRIGALSAFDPVNLLAELNDLSGEGFDPAALNFTAQDMARIEDDAARVALSQQSAAQPDDPAQAFSASVRDNNHAVRFDVMIPPDDASVVYDAIVAAKEKFSVDNSGDALVALVNEIHSTVM